MDRRRIIIVGARTETDLLIVGAGPFGLSLAAYAGELGIDHIVVGEPMAFWTSNMPGGMFLRSACDWHLDASNVDTIEAYVRTIGSTPKDVEPLSLKFYLGYARWFQAQKKIGCYPAIVERLERLGSGERRFCATLQGGVQIAASSVVLALGFGYFSHIPQETATLIPAHRFGHTCDFVDLASCAGRRVLIIGGRQSAFEWAALLHEAGASTIDVSYRHDTPAFAPADWSWVSPLVDAMVDNPAWFRRLSREGKAAVNRRMWAEGRLKLEPWLAPRIETRAVRLWPRTRVVRCEERGSALRITFDTGASVLVDHVIFATGYRVDMTRLPFLAASPLLADLACRNGSPVLDEHFQSSVPGLYVTSMAATEDFGPFFAFTVAARCSATIIGRDMQRTRAGGAPA